MVFIVYDCTMFVAAENAEATFIPKYHKGVWINGSYTCCNQISKNAIGCEVTSTERGKINGIFSEWLSWSIAICCTVGLVSQTYLCHIHLCLVNCSNLPLYSYIWIMTNLIITLFWTMAWGQFQPTFKAFLYYYFWFPTHSHKFLDLCVRTKIQSYHIMKRQW